ncbi:24425_t:CDS:2 [Cetraspora pellucida]|uniref:24425_t:CDS:1 n=1 Tax=Cetraspora pellucida TaxID=1433469 RepID=A0A9N9D7V7_9GLOM|nr:24425_t:CDS:2 [Cetraspora pellucida]
MDRIDMSLDDIIKTNKKKLKQGTKVIANSNNGNANNSSLNNKNRTGPIRARSAGKKLTRQKANPYPKKRRNIIFGSFAFFLTGFRKLEHKPKIIKTGNSNGVWRHDLFPTLLPGSNQTKRTGPFNGSSIQHRLGTGKPPVGSGVTSRLSIKGVAGVKQSEFSFKGEGGPASIVISNLAPGTSANDIKTVFMEFGDISTVNMKEERHFRGAPVTAELTFESKASALAAINKYNTALVDGRVLKVQFKQSNTNTGAASYRMRNKFKPQLAASTQNGRLYSDQLVSGIQRNRRSGGKGKQPSFTF